MAQEQAKTEVREVSEYDVPAAIRKSINRENREINEKWAQAKLRERGNTRDTYWEIFAGLICVSGDGRNPDPELAEPYWDKYTECYLDVDSGLYKERVETLIEETEKRANQSGIFLGNYPKYKALLAVRDEWEKFAPLAGTGALMDPMSNSIFYLLGTIFYALFRTFEIGPFHFLASAAIVFAVMVYAFSGGRMDICAWIALFLFVLVVSHDFSCERRFQQEKELWESLKTEWKQNHRGLSIPPSIYKCLQERFPETKGKRSSPSWYVLPLLLAGVLAFDAYLNPTCIPGLHYLKIEKLGTAQVVNKERGKTQEADSKNQAGNTSNSNEKKTPEKQVKEKAVEKENGQKAQGKNGTDRSLTQKEASSENAPVASSSAPAVGKAVPVLDLQWEWFTDDAYGFSFLYPAVDKYLGQSGAVPEKQSSEYSVKVKQLDMVIWYAAKFGGINEIDREFHDAKTAPRVDTVLASDKGSNWFYLKYESRDHKIFEGKYYFGEKMNQSVVVRYPAKGAGTPECEDVVSKALGNFSPTV